MGKITVEIEIKTFGTPLYGLSHPILYQSLFSIGNNLCSLMIDFRKNFEMHRKSI